MASPAVYWQLNELSGTTAADSSGNAADGVYSGGYTQGRPGPFAGTYATRFDGSTGIAYSSGSAATVPATTTITAWFRSTAAAGGIIAGFSNTTTAAGTTGGPLIGLDSSGKAYAYVFASTNKFVTSIPEYNNGFWHHIAGVIDNTGNTMTLYVDGASAGTPVTSLGTPLRTAGSGMRAASPKGARAPPCC